jgi:hypothetical protein
LPAWSVTKPLPSVPHNPPLDPGLWRPDGSKPVFSKIASVPIRTRVCLGRVPSVAPAASLAPWRALLKQRPVASRASLSAGYCAQNSSFCKRSVRLRSRIRLLREQRVRLASKRLCGRRRIEPRSESLQQTRARRADGSIARRLLDSRLQVHDSRIYVLNGLVAMTARNLGG